MKLVFERSVKGHGTNILPALDVPLYEVGADMVRQSELHLPELGENEISRHYTELAEHTFGVNKGFYPLGSCTMKYNPRINEELAQLPGFTSIHPLQNDAEDYSCREVLNQAREALCEVTGMDDMTFEPAAGAHGEFTGMLLIKAYHRSRSDNARTRVLVPDSAHGTNPATAAMCGFTVVNIPSNKDGGVDIEALRDAVGSDTAALMLTNPNTVGLFDPNILEISKIVHDAGGLMYYDGANLNAIMGVARPGDMGFDVVHLNLHKTFSTPHGGGGPGCGPVGCKAFLSPFLPYSMLADKSHEQSIGQVRAFHGNFLVVVKALAYIKALGAKGLREASQTAVLNANYFMHALSSRFTMAYPAPCMHEFVMSLQGLKDETGVSALDFAKSLIDAGMHPPTMYFPLIVHEALMAEPTETESLDTLNDAAAAYLSLWDAAHEVAEAMHSAPKDAFIGRPDEVKAAREPRLKYDFND